MTVQSDKWIKKMAKENSMISPFEDKQVRGNKISLEFLLMVMMQEFQMNLKYLQM